MGSPVSESSTEEVPSKKPAASKNGRGSGNRKSAGCKVVMTLCAVFALCGGLALIRFAFFGIKSRPAVGVQKVTIAGVLADI